MDAGIPCSLADNSAAGYDKITDGLLSTLARWAIRTGEMPSYLKEMKINQEGVLLLAQKPSITFGITKVDRAFREVENLRWKEITGDETQRSEPEKTVDVADEGPDCVRYAMQSELFWRTAPKIIHKDSYKAQIRKRQSSLNYKKYHKWA